MSITLRKAVDKFCGNEQKYKTLKYYLKKVLRETKYQDLVLEETEQAEISIGFVTVVFTWDNVYAINHISGKYVDLTCPQNAFEVFD